MASFNYRDTSKKSMLRKLALQLFELRRPRARELLPREKQYLAALEQMEREGKLPEIKGRPAQMPKLTLNHGAARNLASSLRP